MDEHLVGYALGSLDPVTEARVGAHVRLNPQARADLDLIEQALAPLSADADVEAPPGLAVNTLALVARHRCMLPTAPAPSPHQVGVPPRRWVRWPDGLVAALLVVIVGGLAFPLLARQWQAQQRAACADAMRQLHAAASAYGDAHEGAFPLVEATGPRAAAGVFVPLLADAGLLRDLPVGCPAAAPRGRGESAPRSVAALEALYRSSPDDYREAVRDLAGRYAYSLGYVDDDHHAGLRRDSGDTLPLLADGPGDGGNSANHGGAGQNVLHVGGHVRWCVHPGVGIDGDNIYLDRHRRVHAGVCRSDSVLGAGDAQPYPAE